MSEQTKLFDRERLSGCICNPAPGGVVSAHLLHCPHHPTRRRLKREREEVRYIEGGAPMPLPSVTPAALCDANIASCTEDFKNSPKWKTPRYTQKARVRDLMMDWGWHRAAKIRLVAGDGIPASEGLRRLRELRHEFRIEKRRCGSGGTFEYRLVKP